jgi:hypothetical protein
MSKPKIPRWTPEYLADWLVDAVATATQNRALLRGDPGEDKVLTEAIYLNGLKAIKMIIDNAERDESR